MFGFGFDMEEIAKGCQEQHAQDVYTQAMEQPAAHADGSASGGKQGDAAAMTDVFGNYADEATLTDEQKAQRKDRAAAARDLAGNFDIVAPDYKGPRKPNQLTPEEFAKVANTYSDIRTNKSDIKLMDGIVPGLPLDEQNAWVMGKTPEEVHKLNEERRAEYEAHVKAKQDLMMGDIGTLMKTEAGRELVFKLSNNVNQDGKHHTTELSGDGDMNQGWATGDNASGAAAYNGYGTSARASYGGGKRGSDLQLFEALSESLHVTTGTRQNGSLGDNCGTQRAADGHLKGKTDEHLPEAMRGMDRERAQIVGLAGYGTKLNGKTITENAYAREQRRLHPQDADLYKQRTSVY